MIQNLHLLRCYRSCLVANKLHEAKRTNLPNYTRRNYTAKTAPNYDEQYGWIHATLRNVTQWHKESAHKILLQLALLHKNNKQTKKNVRRCDLHRLLSVDARETLKHITDIRSKRLNLMDSRPWSDDKIHNKCEPKGTAMRWKHLQTASSKTTIIQSSHKSKSQLSAGLKVQT